MHDQVDERPHLIVARQCAHENDPAHVFETVWPNEETGVRMPFMKTATTAKN